MTAALELVGIAKRFGSVVALDGADFILEAGEVHGLLGENGAGKSTLMHIAFGLHSPDRGSIRIRGVETRVSSPTRAKALGLGMVHQHFTSVPALTVRENLWLAAGEHGSPAGDPPRASPAIDAAARLRQRLWEGIDPKARAETLSVSAKQRLEILQALATGARTLLLDEPTAVLAPAEVAELLTLLREFAAGGGSVVFITHKLAEVIATVDRVTVLRRGKVTFTGSATGQSQASLAAAMVGPSGPTAGIGATVSATTPAPLSESSAPLVVSGELEIRPGEIVGIAAVEGNGQRELLRVVAGVIRPPAGTTVAGPVALIPEDRTTEGLIPGFSLTENVVLGLPSDPRWASGPWLRWPAASARTALLIEEFGINAAGPAAAVRSMSGGNQQKLVFARALEARPAVLVAENPTRGLDVQATSFVHARLRAAAAAGAAVLVYSADLDEVLTLATRVLVMDRNQLRQPPPGATRETIGAMMLGLVP